MEFGDLPRTVMKRQLKHVAKTIVPAPLLRRVRELYGQSPVLLRVTRDPSPSKPFVRSYYALSPGPP